MEGSQDLLAGRFIDALGILEKDGDAGRLEELFADDAELTSPTETEPLRGPEGARRFWRDYRSAFGRVRSEFERVIRTERGAVLEWRSTGSFPDGEPVEYRGVSLLEFADGRVTRFRTYYDTAAFLQVSGRTPDTR